MFSNLFIRRFNLVEVTGRIVTQMCSRSFHALPSTITNSAMPIAPKQNSWSLSSVRTTTKNTFPRPSERKRLKVHGWRVLLSTKNGRRRIMRRILKGRFYLSH